MDKNFNSDIYQIIDELEDYISSCRNKFMSSTEIVVNKDTIEDFINSLKRKTPDEIEYCKKIIKNQEAILDDARAKAKNLIDSALAETDQMLNQNEIMKRAYEQAEDVVSMAQAQAQNTVDAAQMEANEVRLAATQYMEDMMNYLENTISEASTLAADHYSMLINNLNQFGNRIKDDHKQLHPDIPDQVMDVNSSAGNE